ncbi:MAG: hypothetical protein AAF547_11470 [Actinomycetota bacterium]
MVLSILLVVANVLGVGMIVPQVVRLAGARGSAGVSGAWVGVGLSLNAWWFGYGLSTSLWGLLPVATGAAALYGVMAVLLVRLTGIGALPAIAGGAAVPALAPLPFLLLDGWPAAGLAIGGAYAIQFAPAAVAAVRSADVSGISPTTWFMALVEAAIWFGYGLVMADRALVVGGFGASVAALIILVRLGAVSGTGRLRPRLAVG